MNLRTGVLSLLLCACQLSGACGKENTLLQPEDVFGTYQLTSIGGEPLPFAGEWESGRKRSTISGFLDLNPDFSWRRVTVERREYQDGSPTETETYDWEGTRWVLEGKRLTLRGWGPVPGMVSKDRVEIGRSGSYEFGLIWVYSR